MRIILFIISFTLLAEAGVDTIFNKTGNALVYFALEGTAEEELPIEKDNLNPDKQFIEKYIYNNNYFRQKQNYALSIKYNLVFVSHPIFSPPPEC
jgi:hypothetical protein